MLHELLTEQMLDLVKWQQKYRSGVHEHTFWGLKCPLEVSIGSGSSLHCSERNYNITRQATWLNNWLHGPYIVVTWNSSIIQQATWLNNWLHGPYIVVTWNSSITQQATWLNNWLHVPYSDMKKWHYTAGYVTSFILLHSRQLNNNTGLIALTLCCDNVITRRLFLPRFEHRRRSWQRKARQQFIIFLHTYTATWDSPFCGLFLIEATACDRCIEQKVIICNNFAK
jgi:hypothetical protein